MPIIRERRFGDHILTAGFSSYQAAKDVTGKRFLLKCMRMLWRILGNLLVRNDTGFAALSTNVISQTKLEICLRQSLKPVQFAWNLSSGRSRIRISHKINFLWLRTKIKKFFHPHSVEETTRSVEAPTVDFNITKLKYIIRAHDISCGLRIFKIPE